MSAAQGRHLCLGHGGWGGVQGRLPGGDHEVDLEEAQAGGRTERATPGRRNRLGCERYHGDISVGARMGVCVSETE